MRQTRQSARPSSPARRPHDPPPGDPDPPPVDIGAAPRRALPGLAAAVLAASSGALLVLAFPPYRLWWLAPAAVAALAVAVRGQRARRGAWLGALHGLVFFTWLLHWTGIYVGPFPWLLLAAFEATYLALLGAGLAATSRLADRTRWIWPLLVGVGWVAQEALRSRWPFGGFPWGRLAFALDDAPLLGLAGVGGAPLVSFGAALAGGLLAAAVRQLRRRDAWPAAVVFVGTASLVVFAGLAIPLDPPQGRSVRVAVIQGNVPRLGLDFNAQRRAVLDNHVQTTIDLARRVEAGTVERPDLVVWPENSSDIDPLRNADAGAQIDRAAQAIGVPILVGAVLDGPGRFITNAGVVWDPVTGPGARYAKRHPVPFAEYVPFRPFARAVTDKVDLVRRDFYAGDPVGVLDLGPARVGDVICFEVAYDGLVTDTVAAGAQLLVVQTNNATFGRSAESAQQLAMVRLRAVEHGRWALMASTSGVSASVAPDGRILDETALFTRDAFVRAITLGEHRTLASRLGAWPEFGLVGLALAALVATALAALATRRDGRSEPTTATDGQEATSEETQ